MALLWADSFDHYGGVFANMFSGAWASYQNSSGTPAISSSFSRTGTYSLALTGNSGTGTVKQGVKRSLPGLRSRVGFGFGCYQPTLPVNNDAHIVQVLNNSAAPILTLCMQNDGSIHVRKGDETGTIIGISDSVLTAGTFHHIEFATTFDTVAGLSEVRVNQQVVLSDGGLNLGSAQAASVQWVKVLNNSSYYIDDVFAWDDTGSFLNDFIGGQRILTEFPNGDTAQADWSLNGAATGYGCINQVGQDGDLTYLSSANVGDKSDFSLPSLPPELSSIAAVYVPLVARLNAAGIGNVQPSMKSAAALLAGNDDPLTPGYSTYGSVFDHDPNTSAAWTKSGLEAALLRIEKSL